MNGNIELLNLWENDRDAYFTELRRFIELHKASVASNRDKFADYVANGPAAWATRAESLLAGDDPDPMENEILNRPGDELRFGMCGVLHRILTTGIPGNFETETE